jgi:hypothetical protein
VIQQRPKVFKYLTTVARVHDFRRNPDTAFNNPRIGMRQDRHQRFQIPTTPEKIRHGVHGQPEGCFVALAEPRKHV